MPSAYTQNFYHTVFSTKERVELISPEIEERLYPFLGGIARDLRCQAVAINGMPEHVHLLIRYRTDLSHADLLRHLKGRSSMWIHETFPKLAAFSWQEGYGGFTVSKSMVETVENYIRNQKEHHKKQDYKSEFLQLLRLHGVDFDPETVFD